MAKRPSSEKSSPKGASRKDAPKVKRPAPTGKNANQSRIYKLSEMEADHVTAWSKGGQSGIDNCEMLCETHNRAKGNR